MAQLCALTVGDHFTFREYALQSRLANVYPLTAHGSKLREIIVQGSLGGVKIAGIARH